MPTETAKDEIFLMFERSTIPKLEIKEMKPPKTIGCIVTSIEYGKSALEFGIKLKKKWNSKIKVYSWVRYYVDVIHILDRVISAEKLLEQQIHDEYDDIKNITAVMSPSPTSVQAKIKELTATQGRSIDLIIKKVTESSLQLLTIPSPLFDDEEHKRDSLGNEIEILLRTLPRSLPICLVPRQTSGDNNTVVVVIHPEVISTLTSRILQLFDSNTKIVLVSVLDPKLVDLFYLMQSREENEESSQTKDSIESNMKERLHGFMEQVVTTIRGKVKVTETKIVSGSIGLSIATIVEKYDAANLLVMSRSTSEDLLDPEVELLGRLVPNTRLFIVWN